MYELNRVFQLLERGGIERDQVLRISEVGSTALGVGTEDTDTDFLVVYGERFSDVLRENVNSGSKMIRTKPKGVRSEPGDIDIQAHTLRRYASLLGKMNPSILVGSYSQPIYSTPQGESVIRALVATSPSQAAFQTFMGYLDSQLSRWTGEKSKNVNRIELVERHGYDTKYASHALRLAIQGIEFLTTGELQVPMNASDASLVLQVKRGEIDERDALDLVQSYKEKLEHSLEDCPLPRKTPWAEIESIVLGFYKDWFHVP